MSSDAPAAARRPTADAGADLRRLGKYAIERQLGVGGMGTVYLAVDTQLKRTVALKVLPRERAENPILVRRFKSEGQAAALLQHRNIVSVYEAGEADGYLFLALEYVDGIDVLEWIRKRGPLPVKRSIEIIRQTAEALQHAYEKNIVHRDIKPSNLMVARDGTLKLTDMGLARSVDDTLDTTITRDGTTVGTVDYMAPEQAADSKSADIRSDLYSLGCTWYHMLTGSAPFPEGSVTNKLAAHATARLPDPRDKNPSVPEAVVAVLHRMMAKRREDRYQTPNELLTDLTSDVLRHGGDPVNLLSMLTDEEDWFDSGSVELGSDEIVHVPESVKESKSAKATPEVPEETAARQRKPPPPGQPGRQKPPQTSGLLGGLFGRRRPKPADGEAPDDTIPEARRQRMPGAPDEEPAGPHQETTAGEVDRQGKPRPPKLSRSQPVPTHTQPEAPTRKKPGSTRQKLTRSQPVRQVPRTDSPEPPERGPETPAAASRPARERLTRKSVIETPVGGGEPAASGGLQLGVDVRQIFTLAILLIAIAAMGWWGYTNWTRNAGLGPVANPYATAPGQDAGLRDDGSPAPEPDPDQPEAVDTAASPVGNPVVDASPRTTELRSILPDWLRSDWVRPPSNALPVLRVVRGGRGGPNVVGVLDEALRQLGPRGGEIELTTVGPWSLTPATLNAGGRVTIRGTNGNRPLIAVNAADFDASGRCIDCRGGRLELSGLDIVIATGGNETDARRLLSLTDADIILRNCTFTVLGPGATEILSIQGRSRDGNRVLVENCLMRGDRLTALHVRQSGCDLVFDNSLFDSESAPVIRIVSGDADQTLRVVNSTLLSGNSVFALEHTAGRPAPRPLQLELARSLYIARSTDSAVFRLDGWPATETRRIEEPRATSVRMIARHVRLVGWRTPIRHTTPDGETLTATDEAGWRQFWSQPLPSDDFLPDDPRSSNLPAAALNTPASVDELYGELARAGVGARSLLGVDPAQIPVVSEALVRRVQTVIDRPRLPANFSEWEAKQTVRFDLNRRADKFAEFLNGSDCPDDARVVCFGSGLRTLPPVTLQNRRLRIEFEQAEGNPLTLQPAESTATALFTIDGGRIDLVNGNFVIPDSSRRPYPQTFLRTAERGEFSLRTCSVVAQSSISDGSPLIDLSGLDPQPRTAFAAITSSFLSAPDAVLRGRLAGRSVEIDNSILVSTGDLLVLSAGDERGDLLLHHCTLSAGRGIVTLIPESGPPISNATSDAGPLHLFARNVVYAPPLTPSARSALLTVADVEELGRTLNWWESGCGYSSQLPHLLRAAETGFGGSFQSGWGQHWGSGQILDALHGSQGVLLKGVLPERLKLRPVDFELDPSCRAATWSETGGPIGADVTRVGPRLEPPSATSSPTTPTRPGPGRTRPDF